MQIAELFATLGINLKSEEWTNANQALELFDKTVGRVFGGIKKVIGEGLEVIERVADSANEVGRVSEQFGIAAGTLIELRAAAMFADVSVETLDQSLGKLARTASEAADGSQEAMEAMSGIALKDSNGQLKTVDKLLLSVADKMEGLKSATERVALAQKVFGRGGTAMVPMLSKGRAEIEKSIAVARKYSVKLTEGQREASEAFEWAQKSWALARKSLDKVFASEANIKSFANIYQTFADLASNPAVRYAIDKLGKAFNLLLKAVEKPLAAIKEWLDDSKNQKLAIQALDAVITTLAMVAFPALIKAVYGLITASAGIAPMVAAFAALVLIVDDFWTGLHGGESVFGDVGKWLENLGNQVDEAVKKAAKLTLGALKDALIWIGNFLGWKEMKDDIVAICDWIDKLIAKISKFRALGGVSNTEFNQIIKTTQELVNQPYVAPNLRTMPQTPGVNFISRQPNQVDLPPAGAKVGTNTMPFESTTTFTFNIAGSADPQAIAATVDEVMQKRHLEAVAAIQGQR